MIIVVVKNYRAVAYLWFGMAIVEFINMERPKDPGRVAASTLAQCSAQGESLHKLFRTWERF